LIHRQPWQQTSKPEFLIASAVQALALHEKEEEKSVVSR
jgi:hypothetical protein